MDISGARIDPLAEPLPETKGREWIISFTKYRIEGKWNTAPLILDNVIPANKFSITKIQEQSPPVEGNYGLSFNGTPINEHEFMNSDI